MGLVATPKGGKDFPIPDPDWYVARCFAVIDLGTQQGSFQGAPKFQHKVTFGFELLGTMKGMEDPGPFTLWQRFTLSFNEKAALRKFIGSWRGRPFSDEEVANGYDVSALAVKNFPAYLNVVHRPSADGTKTYANIDSIGPVPKALGPVPVGTIPPVVFDIDNFDQRVFDTFSDHLKETIKKSPEYAEAMAKKTGKVHPGADDDFLPPSDDLDFVAPDDVPF